MVKQNALPEMPFFFDPDRRALSAGFAKTYRMVPKAGLEPARLTPLPPQDSVSTNSTTWA